MFFFFFFPFFFSKLLWFVVFRSWEWAVRVRQVAVFCKGPSATPSHISRAYIHISSFSLLQFCSYRYGHHLYLFIYIAFLFIFLLSPSPSPSIGFLFVPQKVVSGFKLDLHILCLDCANQQTSIFIHKQNKVCWNQIK